MKWTSLLLLLLWLPNGGIKALDNTLNIWIEDGVIITNYGNYRDPSLFTQEENLDSYTSFIVFTHMSAKYELVSNVIEHLQQIVAYENITLKVYVDKKLTN